MYSVKNLSRDKNRSCSFYLNCSPSLWLSFSFSPTAIGGYRGGSILTRCSTDSELSSSTWQMPFRAPFGTDVYVRNRLRIADSIPLLAGTDSFLGTADLRRRSIPESGISEFVGPKIHESMISGRYPIISI